jgi:hypothetical protein
MSTRQKFLTHVSIAAVLFIGLLAQMGHRSSVTEFVTFANRSIEIKLVPIEHPIAASGKELVGVPLVPARN